jgi:hypothetical protein
VRVGRLCHGQTLVDCRAEVGVADARKSDIKRVSHRHFFFRFCLKLFFFSKEKHGFSLAARRCVAIG